MLDLIRRHAWMLVAWVVAVAICITVGYSLGSPY